VDTPRSTPALDLGKAGEDATLADYRQRGYLVIARNWRCALGEMDLVLRGGRTLVFCEVKTRRGSGFGGPHESVDPRKQRKLRLLAEAFLAAHPGMAEDVRFDVASVTHEGSGPPFVHVFEDAF
jgi:putative endonuclease